MTPHKHREFVPGCFRCELGRDEEVYSFEPVAVSAEFHALIRDAVEESAESRRVTRDQEER